MAVTWNGLPGLCVLLCFKEQSPQLIFKVPSAHPSGFLCCCRGMVWESDPAVCPLFLASFQIVSYLGYCLL